MRLTEREIEAIRHRAAALAGVSWIVRHENGHPFIHVQMADEDSVELRVMRDTAVASDEDITFIGCSRSDVERLLAAVQEDAQLDGEELETIMSRCRYASPAPWREFLEEDGGTGGSSVIWVTDEEDSADMYLCFDTKLAPGPEFVFVAHVRQDIPALVSHIDDA